MLRIKGISKDDASEETRKILEEQEKQYGSILNTARVYALRPTIQKGVQALRAGIVASGLRTSAVLAGSVFPAEWSSLLNSSFAF